MPVHNVLLGTDGVIDYVATPDGVRHALGPISALRFVKAMVRGGRNQRDALNGFLKDGEVMVQVDLDQMFNYLAPKRARWASANPFISGKGEGPLYSPRRDGLATEGNMSDAHFLANLDRGLTQLETRVALLNKQASLKQRDPGLQDELRQIAAAIHLKDFGDQSKNDSSYGLGAPKVDTVEDGYVAPKEVTHPKTASFESLQKNAALAEDILIKVAEVNDKIESLVAAGRKFNANKARADLHEVTAKVASILKDADIAESWVTKDLVTLGETASHIHGLFERA